MSNAARKQTLKQFALRHHDGCKSVGLRRECDLFKIADSACSAGVMYIEACHGLTMPNANNAKLVRIATRAFGGDIFSDTPLSALTNRFDVVVEGRSGRVLGASGQPYGLRISALDLTTGRNPHSAANNFSQQRTEAFDSPHGWPDKVAIFTITLNDLLAVQGHLFRYYAILTSANHILSFVESPLFLLHMG